MRGMILAVSVAALSSPQAPPSRAIDVSTLTIGAPTTVVELDLDDFIPGRLPGIAEWIELILRSSCGPRVFFLLKGKAARDLKDQLKSSSVFTDQAELENTLERAVLLTEGPVIAVEDLRLGETIAVGGDPAAAMMPDLVQGQGRHVVAADDASIDSGSIALLGSVVGGRYQVGQVADEAGQIVGVEWVPGPGQAPCELGRSCGVYRFGEQDQGVVEAGQQR